MKTSIPETLSPAWMSQFSDPKTGQPWFQQQTAGNSNGAKSSGDLAVVLDPVMVIRLQSDYMQQFSALWQDLLASKVPDIADKRFASPAWQSNALHAFN